MVHNIIDHVFCPSSSEFSLDQQAGSDTHSCGEPEDAALRATPKFIGLDLTEVEFSLADEILLNTLRVFTRFVDPVGNCPLIQLESGHNRGDRTSEHQQREDDHDKLMMSFESEERRAMRLSEGFSALMTFESLLSFGVDTDLGRCGAIRAGGGRL
ncbi:hypothetical protein ACFQDE_17125 [Deinococcus caeni]|uniref:hypothetical protein n=1 Tax=Deinococcus caeni TaxID=569127 RepID=UPI00360D45D7